MKQIMNKPSLAGMLLGLAVCSFLFSFTRDFGGEVYEVYLNDKLVLQQQVWRMADIPKLNLDKDMDKARLSVNYNNCGHTDTGRSITAINSKNEILKEWKFSDPSGSENKRMIFSVRELLGVTEQGKISVELVYSSKEIKKRSLAIIVFTKDGKTASL